MVFAGSASATEATESKPESSALTESASSDLEHRVGADERVPEHEVARAVEPAPDTQSFSSADALRDVSPEHQHSLASLLEPSAAPANDDQESIGTLVKALGVRHGWTPAVGIAVATAFWLFCILAIYAEQTFSNSEVVIFGLGLTGLYAVLLLMIVMFFRAREMQSTTRSLIKVVAGLSNPDFMAANKVGSISQIVKSEMTSVDASLDRTLARAELLETRLRSEYLDLERAFAANEQQFRDFLDSLSSERAAVVTNAEKVRAAISGAHSNLSRDLDEASGRFSRLVAEAGVGLASTIDQKSADMTKAAADASDRCASRLDSALEGSIIRASDLVETRGDKFAALLAAKGNDLDEKLAARIKDASDLLERQIKDAQETAAYRVDTMATQVHKLLKKMDDGIGERGEAINTMLANRTIDISKTLKETGNEFRQTLDRTASFTDDFVKKAQSVNQQLGMQIGRLNEDVVIPLETVTAALDEKGRMLTLSLADRFSAIDSVLTGQSNRLATLLDREIETLRVSLDTAVDTIKAVLGSSSSDLKTGMADRAQKIEAVLNERLSAFAALISENRTRLAFELSSHTQALDHLLDRQRALVTSEATAPSTPRPVVEARRVPDLPATSSRPRDPLLTEDRARPTAASLYRDRQFGSPAASLVSRLADSAPALRSRLIETNRPPAGATAALPGRSAMPSASSPATSIASPPVVTSSNGAAPRSAPVRSTPALPDTKVPPRPAVAAEAAKPAGGDASVTANKTWLSDLLARASVDEDSAARPGDKGSYDDAPISSIAANVGNFIKPEELQTAWERYNSGSPGEFQSIYTPKGAVMQLKIKQRLVEDQELRQAVESYVTEFERLLHEVHEDSGDNLIFEYLRTDAGKVYTMLAHASNRLGLS
jgi:hypothetical protein